MTDNQQIAERAVLNALKLGIARLGTVALRSRLGLTETRRALHRLKRAGRVTCGRADGGPSNYWRVMEAKP